MWGFYNARNRLLAHRIFDKIIDPKLEEKSNSKQRNRWQGDQRFLSKHVYPVLLDKSVIHDSYTCRAYKNSEPFPTKRLGSCFVGDAVFVNKSRDCESDKKFFECPLKCRPVRHKEWIYC